MLVLLLINHCFPVLGAERSWQQEVFGGRVSKHNARTVSCLIIIIILVTTSVHSHWSCVHFVIFTFQFESKLYHNLQLLSPTIKGNVSCECVCDSSCGLVSAPSRTDTKRYATQLAPDPSCPSELLVSRSKMKRYMNGPVF